MAVARLADRFIEVLQIFGKTLYFNLGKGLPISLVVRALYLVSVMARVYRYPYLLRGYAQVLASSALILN
jgi:hypothetical protein